MIPQCDKKHELTTKLLSRAKDLITRFGESLEDDLGTAATTEGSDFILTQVDGEIALNISARSKHPFVDGGTGTVISFSSLASDREIRKSWSLEGLRELDDALNTLESQLKEAG